MAEAEGEGLHSTGVVGPAPCRLTLLWLAGARTEGHSARGGGALEGGASSVLLPACLLSPPPGDTVPQEGAPPAVQLPSQCAGGDGSPTLPPALL